MDENSRILWNIIQQTFSCRDIMESFSMTNHPLYVWSIYVNNIVITLDNLMSRQSTHDSSMHRFCFLSSPNSTLNSVKSFCRGFLFHSMVFNSQNGFSIKIFTKRMFFCLFYKTRWKKRKKAFREIKMLFMGWLIKTAANVS